MDREFEVRIKLTEDYIGDLDEDQVMNMVAKLVEEIEVTGAIFSGVLIGEVLEVKWTNKPEPPYSCPYCNEPGGH